MIKYGEFCAGIGGFRLGIEESEIPSKCVYINEIDEKCEKTYHLNFGEYFDSRDIFNINVESIPQLDVLCSGFPCQPFSIAGKQKGLKDTRGTIILKLFEIIDAVRPKAIFLENVANLRSHANGQTLEMIQSTLIQKGYTVFSKILDSAFFGVPQSRPRLYIVAFDQKIFGNIRFSFPKESTTPQKMRSIIKHGDYSIPISKKWEEYIDYYTGAISEEDLSFPLPKTRKSLERIAENCDLNDCVFQIRSSGIRAYSMDAPFPTFAVSNSGGGAMIPVLSKERRHLNLVEMKRIMGFPDTYCFDVSRTDSIKQLANAVCPPVISAIYKQIAHAMAVSVE